MGKKSLTKLQQDMNISQLKLFQRLQEILPTMDNREVIEELIAMHVLGKTEKERAKRILNQFGVDKGESIENKTY